MKEKLSAALAVKRLSAPMVQAMPGIIQGLLYTAVGFLLAQTPVLGIYQPFAAAWTAAVPLNSLGAAAAGSAIGMLMQGFDGAAGACAVLLIGGVRWMLSEWKRLTGHPLFAPGCAAAATLLTELLVMGSAEQEAPVAAVVCLGLLSGGSTWFFARGVEVMQTTNGFSHCSPAGYAGCILVGGSILAGLTTVRLGAISLGGVGALALVLFCAVRRRVAGGCLSGTVIGAVMALSAGREGLFPISYGVMGMVAGCFAPLGRAAAALTMMLTSGIVVLLLPEAPIGALYEAVAASLIFLMIPSRRMEQISALFFPESEEASPKYMRRSVVMRLDFAAKAIAHVSHSVEEVSRELLRQCAPTVSGVYQRAVEETCAGCGLRMMCWQTHYETNTDAMNQMTTVLLQHGRVARSDLPAGLQAVCKRPERLAQSITAHYEDYVNHAAAEQRVTELRAVVSSQFRGLSDMLSEMADSFRHHIVCDEKISRSVRGYLESQGAVPLGVVCSTDENDRMRVEFCVRWNGMVKPETLRRPLEQLCGRRFGPGGATHSDGVTRMVFSERAMYRAETGYAQHICRGAQLCGDHYEFFHDGAGRAVMVLSDGMGSGGRAAVDSAMTCGILSRLVLSGLGYDCALRMINSSLYVKPGDESLATVDIATVDLYTGQTVFRKAGAAAGFIRRGKEVEQIDLASLPAGILQDIRFAQDEKKLMSGDWVVLVSDGAMANGTGWLTECIRNAEDTPQALCEEILKTAEQLRRDGHDDDITAAALRLDQAG